MRVRKVAGVLLLALGAASCRKLDSEHGGLSYQPVQLKDAIPAEYGELEGVTSNDARPNVAQLWFKKDDGTVVMVAVNFIDGKVSSNALMIPRK